MFVLIEIRGNCNRCGFFNTFVLLGVKLNVNFNRNIRIVQFYISILLTYAVQSPQKQPDMAGHNNSTITKTNSFNMFSSQLYTFYY